MGVVKDKLFEFGKLAFDSVEPGSIGWCPNKDDVVAFCPSRDFFATSIILR